MRQNFFHQDRKFFYVFGSNGEGTTTRGLHSDIDVLSCIDIPVVERISDAPLHGLSFLMVADETTKPGYFKLQGVHHAVAIYSRETIDHEYVETDRNGRVCLRNFHRQDGDVFQSTNGPAVTHTGVNGYLDADLVLAFQCQHIPSCAKSRLRSVISNNRLNETQVNMLKQSGCFFVGKNHSSSQNGPIEWRLSFSLQERELMASLNPTQHKCYILLKMIKTDIIHERVGESISSYHCKTCMLYVVEKTPYKLWTPRNLLRCTHICIELLLHWVKEQYCPNYFMPKENMFDRLEPKTLEKVQVVLEDMTKHWCTCLWSLRCDNIGNVLHDVLFGCGPNFMKVKHVNDTIHASLAYINIIKRLKVTTHMSLKEYKSSTALHLMYKLYAMHTHLLQTKCVRYHTEMETRQAVCYFIPHISLQIAQCVASISLTTDNADLLKILFDTFKYYVEESKERDAISANLICASYCLQSGRYNACEEILLQCEQSLKSYGVSVCGCSFNQLMYRTNAYEDLLRLFGSQDIPYREFTSTCVTGCLTFLPCQADLVPQALHYEMYRSVNTPPTPKNEMLDLWSDCIVVDSKVYLYYLQYVLYTKANKQVYRKDAVDNLVNLLTSDPNLGHIETAVNLLGWIFKQENKLQLALVCFLTSWKIRPIHNAAKWHLIETIQAINRRY